MVITRVINGKIRMIRLTDGELGLAYKEYVINFMKDTLLRDFGLSDEEAESYSVVAYDEYCKGEGLTEYECIEKAYDVYCKKQGIEE